MDAVILAMIMCLGFPVVFTLCVTVILWVFKWLVDEELA